MKRFYSKSLAVAQSEFINVFIDLSTASTKLGKLGSIR